jgi:hypothetical protein
MYRILMSYLKEYKILELIIIWSQKTYKLEATAQLKHPIHKILKH